MREIRITRSEYPSFSEADISTRDYHEPRAVVKCVCVMSLLFVCISNRLKTLTVVFIVRLKCHS